ncbi:hypothetical protein GCM10023116_41550 [Kistimonas scapharcae]|uniref:Uncharacterized protein n=1 Tax=Kistimonas scapharcae TaxID=1036133 RepID=A0ABP8V7U9_9GAMM
MKLTRQLYLLLLLPGAILPVHAADNETTEPAGQIYDMGDGYHNYPPGHTEPPADAPLRYGRTTSSTFPLPSMASEDMADTSVPGALQATAAGQTDDDEREKHNVNVGITIDELEDTIDFALPDDNLANQGQQRPTTISIDVTYSNDSSTDVHVTATTTSYNE